MKYLFATMLMISALLPAISVAQPLSTLVEASLLKGGSNSESSVEQPRELIFQREYLRPEPQNLNSLGFEIVKSARGERHGLSIRAGVSEFSRKAIAGMSLTLSFN